MKKAFLILILFLISPVFAGDKVWTDADLKSFKTNEDTYRYNQSILENQSQQNTIEEYQKDKDSSERERQIDMERQRRIETKRQKEIDKCVAKAQSMIEESTRAKTRAGANAKLKAGQAILDSCYGRSSSTSFENASDSPGPFINVGGPTFVDTSTGKVRNCPRAIGKPTVDINKDCLPE